jgi:anoctamin-10
VRNAEPEKESSAEPQSEAERLRVIYHLITVPKAEGGAGITPRHGEWKNVDAIFPLHDEETNRECMREWSKKTFLSTEDLDRIRNTFGEHVSLSLVYGSFKLTGARLAFTLPSCSRIFGS